jgi:hypothetical protein
MSEEKQQQEQDASVEVKDEESKSLELNDLRLQIENIKKTQKGTDKQNAQLKKDIEEKEKELNNFKNKYLDDQKRIELEKEQESKRLQKQINEAKETKIEKEKLEQQLLKSNFIVDNKVDPRLKSHLNADSVEGLQEQYNNLKNVIDENVSTGVKNAIGQTVPQKGEAGKVENKLGRTPLETLENL